MNFLQAFLCEFGAKWPYWTKLLGDPQAWSTSSSDMFANTLESFGAFDLGMTLKVKVKVTRPTRGLTVTTVIIGLWLIFIELWAWYHAIRTSFGACDLDLGCQGQSREAYSRPTPKKDHRPITYRYGNKGLWSLSRLQHWRLYFSILYTLTWPRPPIEQYCERQYLFGSHGFQ